MYSTHFSLRWEAKTLISSSGQNEQAHDLPPLLCLALTFAQKARARPCMDEQ
jgi:hypothetical protein